MPNKIIKFLSKTHQIPDNEAEIIMNLVKPLTLLKGEFLNKENVVPQHGAFVISGILKEFYTDSKGQDYIRRFVYENWWVVDMYELTHAKPALCGVQAIKKTELYTFTKDDYDILNEKCPVACKVLKEISIAEKYSLIKNEKQKRSLSAQENYQNLLNRYPDIDKTIPLYHIASYLNIKPESLSRIRKQMKLSKS